MSKSHATRVRRSNADNMATIASAQARRAKTAATRKMAEAEALLAKATAAESAAAERAAFEAIVAAEQAATKAEAIEAETIAITEAVEAKVAEKVEALVEEVAEAILEAEPLVEEAAAEAKRTMRERFDGFKYVAGFAAGTVVHDAKKFFGKVKDFAKASAALAWANKRQIARAVGRTAVGGAIGYVVSMVLQYATFGAVVANGINNGTFAYGRRVATAGGFSLVKA